MSNIQIAELLQWLTAQWSKIPRQYLIVMYLGGTVFAFLNCFMGYRLRKVWGCILGILVGAGAGAGAGYFILQDKIMALVCGMAGALILGLLAWLLYKFGVFFMCTGLVYFMITSMFEDPSMKQHMIAIVIGVFAGTLALGYEKQMVIGVTSICGGIGGIHLLMKMLEKDAGAGELLLGLIMAVIGIAVQAAPFTKGKDWEASLFHLPSRKKKRGFSGKRTKKVVKKTEVTHVHRNDESKKPVKKKRYTREWEEEDEYEEEPVQKPVREELQKTQEYTVGQKQYETRTQPKSDFYPGTGIGIDLDDLNRELSQEIQKIYEEEQQ
ncbi:MAG: hypothetical protein UHO63_10155 [Blautia sp.]|nr:hypothetical protein [Blautia sp.]